jgi:hypothetical protein
VDGNSAFTNRFKAWKPNGDAVAENIEVVPVEAAVGQKGQICILSQGQKRNVDGG